MSTSQENADVPVKLTRAEFIGHSLSLISDSQVEQYNFTKDGLVMADLGSEELQIAPIFDWKIVNGHTLVITDTPEGQHIINISYEFKTFTDTNAITTTGKQFRRE